MLNNIFGNKRGIRPRISYCREIQSHEFSLIISLFLSILIGFLKRIAWQNMLMVQINKKLLISCFYLFSLYIYLYHIWLFPRLIHLVVILKKIQVLKKTSLKCSLLVSRIYIVQSNIINKVALLKAYLSDQGFDIFCISVTYLNQNICK